MSEIAGKELSGSSLFLDVGQEFVPTSGAGLPRLARHLALPLSPQLFLWLAFASDFIILVIAGAGSIGITLSAGSPLWRNLIMPCAIALFALSLLIVTKLHRVEVVGDYSRFLRRFVPIWALVLAIVLAVDFLGQSWGARLNAENEARMAVFLAWLMTCGAALAGTRYALTRLFRHAVEQQIVAHDVVVVGATDLAGQFVQRAAADRLGVRVRAIFHDVPGEGATGDAAADKIANMPVCGGIDDLPEYCKRNGIGEVVIALPPEAQARVRNVMDRLSKQPIEIKGITGPLPAKMTPGWCAAPGQLPGIELTPLTKTPIDFTGQIIKGAFDRLFALLALLFLAPVMIACAIGIKLTSPGKVFYRQRRIGYRNSEFMVFKFRSMHEADCDTGKLTLRNDPRVFAFGLLMRKLSLDELPQLFNVLLGHMSLVGPRPHMPEARAAGQLYFDAVPEYSARHRVKPGITGWAQVRGWRGPTETLHQIEQRVAHDLQYIENWSFRLDLMILVKTCLVGFGGKNAF